MRMNYESKSNNKPDSIQHKINFDEVDKEQKIKADKILEEERDHIAKTFKVADVSKLSKKNGQWYIDNMTVEEWDNLFSGNDNSETHKNFKNH